MGRITQSLCATGLIGLVVLIPHTPALAGQSIDPSTLNPVPPSFETCMATGNGAICQGSMAPAAYGPSDNQLFCGTGANAFDTFDSGVSRESAIRYYDQNGNLVRRVVHLDDDGQWSNAVTGTSVPYKQHDIFIDVLAVPGDLNSITETLTGGNVFTLPHEGELAVDNGRETTGPDGNLEFESGRHDILNYILGDTSTLQKLCAALAAP